MYFDTTEQTAGMERAPKLALVGVGFLLAAVGIMKATAGPTLTAFTGITPELVAGIVSPLIAEAIPREYEGSKDWGKTKRVTTGVRSEGNFFRFDMHRKLEEVNDGVWKKYKLRLVEPDKNLTVRIENLRALDSGGYALTLFVAAKVHGWARATVYEHGVHVVSLEAEGDTSIRLSIDAEVGVESVPSSLLIPGVELHPNVTDAKLTFDDFRVTRISNVKGTIAKEIGELFEHALKTQLAGPKLAAKINHSLEKHPEKLRLSPDMLLGKATPK